LKIEKGCKKAIRPNRNIDKKKAKAQAKKARLIGLGPYRSLKWTGLISIYMSATCMPPVFHVGLLMWLPAMCMPRRITDVASSNCP
jgi:hypothetical protein